MSSGGVQRGKPIQHKIEPLADSYLEITVAIRNKETGEWITPQLSQAENKVVEDTVKAIRDLEANSAAWKEASQKGALFEMTPGGIFVQDKDAWKQLTYATKGDTVPNKLRAVSALALSRLDQGGSAIPKEVADHAAAVHEEDVLIEVRVVSPLAAQLDRHHQVNQHFAKNIKTFVKAYRAKRELFEAVMRKAGISDLESAFMFNHYDAFYAALKKWNTGFQAVLKHAKAGDYAAASQAYAALVKNALPELLAAASNATLSNQSLESPIVQKAFQEFADLAHFNGGRVLSNFLKATPDVGTILYDQFIEFREMAFNAKIELPDELLKAFTTMTKLVEQGALALPQFSHLFAQNARFMRFFNTDGLRMSKHALHKRWDAVLKKQGWSQKKIEEFSKLTNEYAGCIRALQQAEQAIKMEADPNKKRALQAQLKELAKALIPRIDQMHKELRKLGGMNQYRKLVSAASELAQVAGAQHQGLINRLQAEANDLVQLMEVRVAYVEILYEELGIFKPKEGVIARNLLHGPHIKDRVFLKTLDDHGWTPKELEDLNTWYDSYMSEAYPIVQAKKNLDADPENVTLQKEFKRIVNEQNAKLNVLIKEFNKTFGKERLNQLEIALGLHVSHVVKGLVPLERSRVGLTQDQARDIDRQIKEANTTISMLSSLRIVEDFNRTDAFIREMDQLADQPMSWDKDFLSELIPNKSSSLMQYGIKKQGQENWQHHLTQNKLTLDDVKAILNLFNKYQKAIEKINILERELEAHPENDRMYKQLINELARLDENLVSLETEFANHLDQIVKLEEAVRDFEEDLKNDVGLMDVSLQGQPTPEMKTAALATKEKANNILAVLGRLSILEAFHQKRAFLEDVRRRFTRSRTVA